MLEMLETQRTNIQITFIMCCTMDGDGDGQQNGQQHIIIFGNFSQ